MARSRPWAAVTSPRLRFPVVVSLGGGHLLGSRLVVSFVSGSLELLAFELGELDAVGGVADVEVQDRPDRVRWWRRRVPANRRGGRVRGRVRAAWPRGCGRGERRSADGLRPASTARSP